MKENTKWTAILKDGMLWVDKENGEMLFHILDRGGYIEIVQYTKKPLLIRKPGISGGLDIERDELR